MKNTTLQDTLNAIQSTWDLTSETMNHIKNEFISYGYAVMMDSEVRKELLNSGISEEDIVPVSFISKNDPR